MIRSLIILLYLLIAVAAGATGDGLNNAGIQTWGHLLEAAEVAILMFAFYAIDQDKVLTLREVLLMFGTYICLRFAFFDYLYNIAAGNSLTYLSHNNFWGKLWLEWLKAEPVGIVWARSLFLGLGILLPIKYLRQ